MKVTLYACANCRYVHLNLRDVRQCHGRWIHRGDEGYRVGGVEIPDFWDNENAESVDNTN